jgi:hypothetical protein
VQKIYLIKGQYFGIPITWFAMDGGTLPDDLSLYYSAVRPSGPYAEPSYLGFVLVSLALNFLPKDQISRTDFLGIFALFVAGVATSSLSFLLALATVSLPRFIRMTTRAKIKVGFCILIVLGAVSFWTGAVDVVSRLERTSGSEEDSSIIARIVLPALTLPNFLFSYPLGVTFSNLPNAIAPFVTDSLYSSEDILNNALFNLMFEFGITGLIMIFFLWQAAAEATVRCYLFVALMFNGSFLAIDKFTVIILTVAMYYSSTTIYAPSRRRPDR